MTRVTHKDGLCQVSSFVFIFLIIIDSSCVQAQSDPLTENCASSQECTSTNIVPEDVGYNVDLVNLYSILPDRSFTIIGNSLEVNDMFIIINEQKLRLNSSQSENHRKKFDFETHHAVDVYINGTSNNNDGDVVQLTVNLQLSDVNDEPPEFTNQPNPFLATMAETTQAGTVVFTLTVTDADSDADLDFRIASVTPRADTSRFQLTPKKTENNTWEAWISTVGNSNFESLSEYTIAVSAIDKNTVKGEKMISGFVDVLVGHRPPQFYASKYTGFIYESVREWDKNRVTTNMNEPLEIRTLSFQKNTVSYTILESDGSPSQSFHIDENAHIFNEKMIDFERTKSVNLTIQAVESGLSPVYVPIEIIVRDENDNEPSFEQSFFYHTVVEDTEIESGILNVTATDLDSGRNGELVFSVEDSDFFEMSASQKLDQHKSYATIKIKKTLDYDHIQDPTYTMKIVVRDKGVPSFFATAQASIYVTNANDNPPVIDNSTSVIRLIDTAGPGYDVYVLQASDIDGDQVSFTLLPNDETSEIFKIQRESNILQTTKRIPRDKDSYNLTIQATDDGSCCSPTKSLNSTLAFTVTIDSVNAHKPDFTNCDQYDSKASVKERSRKGTPIIQIQAEDPDRGENGRVVYAIQSAEKNFPFKIDENTGNITVIRDDITRDEGEYIQVTVTGENQVVDQPLKGWCTFQVHIEDINDHSPVFSKNLYIQDIQHIPASSTQPRIIRQMVATDKDSGVNANLTYSIEPNTIFDITPYTGVVRQINKLESQPNMRCSYPTYCLTITVADNGPNQNRTSETEIRINVKNNQTAPGWIQAPMELSEFNVSENVPVGHVITSFECHSSIDNKPSVAFIVFDSANSIEEASNNFRPSSNGTKMDLIVSARLDYETKKIHQITVICQDYGTDSMHASRNIIINVLDANDNYPFFVGLTISGRYEGSIAEDAQPGTTVMTVAAIDADTKPEFRTIYFRIVQEPNKPFYVKSDEANNRAHIVTKPGLKLDREEKANYVVRIIAKKSSVSQHIGDERLISVTVTDVNDNPPKFEHNLYKCNVSETKQINSIVCSIRADDADTVDQLGLSLSYFFKFGNTNNAFSIRPLTGDIVVSGKLDYELGPKNYSLILVATDQFQLHSGTTTVQISVEDENDNRPVFSSDTYSVKGKVIEEVQYNEFPLIQVTATDADESSKIEYTFVDPVVNFTINPKTGQIYLHGSLDRDGPSPDFTLTVRAQDDTVNPLMNYADVIVFPLDINDNSPIFDGALSGSIDEQSPRDKRVMTVVARDKDFGENGTVEYKLGYQQLNQTDPQYFTIATDGTIFTGESSSLLDREKFDEIFVPIIAYDLGKPRPGTASATVTITLRDINDQYPYFEESEYWISAAENSNGQIYLIQAHDKDSNPKYKNFQFSLDDESDQFSVSRQKNAASINIKESVSIDFETDKHEFTFILKVTDGDPSHENQTTIKVTITDVNDNAPEFVDNNITKTFEDGTLPGVFMTKFNASDKDKGLNSEIIFSIKRESDPRYEFYIDPLSGVVTTRKQLDRETEEIIEITIIATDKGEPPMSSAAYLTIHLTDVNDHAPMFKEDYLPKINENVKNKDTEVIEIFAKDPDSLPFGPPFGFKIPDNCDVPACKYFKLQMNKEGDDKRGTALIKTSTMFDREERKQYFLPIVMWDMRDKNDKRSKTATSTLTIVIGDANDNKHKPGHQDIFVYNYKDLVKPFEIGRVYAEDPDDWDLPDKTFTFLSPQIMKSYFMVSNDTGMINMKEGVPSNIDMGRPPYEFKVNVYDKKYGNTETCTVSVTVKTLEDQAVWKSGSMRLTGVSADDFIIKSLSSSTSASTTKVSKYDNFRLKLASVLDYTESESVEIVSIMDHKDFLDVRFSAHGSPYLNPAQVESAVMLHQNEFESELGIKINQLPINLCTEEIYDDGCHTQLNVTGLANTVNANGTSFVGLQTFTNPVSGCIDCIFPEPNECKGDYCYNGGTCIKDDWGKITCKCHLNFDGPRCQQRRHNFIGTSIAFYEAPSLCVTSRTNFELITTDEDGIIMFASSQIQTSKSRPFQDYIIVELINGYPRIHLNLGTGELILSIDKAYSAKAAKLNDGKWHHIDIDKNGQNVVLTVDKCRSGTVENMKLIDSSCSNAGTVPGADILLNTQGFLQIGGFYPHTRNISTFPSIQAKGFSGCIRNFIHNTKLYDLHFKEMPQWNSGKAHCPKEDRVCQPNNSGVCGKRADCESRWLPEVEVVHCQCHPGWYGVKCQKETPVKYFQSQSFLKWELKPETISQAEREHSIEMMFRTRQLTGTLFSMTSVHQRTILIQLVHGKVTVFYDLGEGQKELRLENAHAPSGQWHTLKVDRFGSEFTISLDNAEGRNYNYITRSRNADVIFNSSAIISAGARLPAKREDSFELTYDLEKTCISDVRFNGKYLPLDQQENSLIQSQNVKNNCSRDDCYSHTCPPNFLCFPLWGENQCRCVDGSHEASNGTCVSDCALNPCYNGGKCAIVAGNVTCSCKIPWEGQFCNILPYDLKSNSENSVLNAGEIAGIVIGIILFLVIIVLVLLILWYRRNAHDDNDTFRRKNHLYIDDDGACENIAYHDEEGAGEEDHRGFDMSVLRIPPENENETYFNPQEMPTLETDRRRNAPQTYQLPRQKMDDFIAKTMVKADKDNDCNTDIDSTKEYNFEGNDSDAGSLSSISRSSSGSDIQNFDYVYDSGPKFSYLADLLCDDQE